MRSSPQPCIVGQSLTSPSLCSTAGLPLCAAHSGDQRSLVSPGSKTHTSRCIRNPSRTAETPHTCSDTLLILECEWYLLSSGLGVLFLPFPHSGDEFYEDSLPVLHLLYGLESRVSAVLHCKLTKRCSVKKAKQEHCSLKRLRQLHLQHNKNNNKILIVLNNNIYLACPFTWARALHPPSFSWTRLWPASACSSSPFSLPPLASSHTDQKPEEEVSIKMDKKRAHVQHESDDE